VRDPYAVVRYLAEHVRPPLNEVLGLGPAPPPAEEDETHRYGGGRSGCAAPPAPAWSAQALCDAFAARHSWRTRAGGRLDTYRAANWILRAALAGTGGVRLAFLPPDTVEE
jgi:hypothetical protein